MCCGQHGRRGDCCDDVPAWEEHRARRWGAGYGPAPWAGSGYGSEFGPAWWQPGKTERKERLESFKKHLEARLADVNEELGKM
jgi:hypothetical protein